MRRGPTPAATAATIATAGSLSRPPSRAADRRPAFPSPGLQGEPPPAPTLRKRFRLWAWGHYKAHEAREHRLDYLFWEATRACNHNCRHCGSDCERSSDTSGELATHEVLPVFEQIVGHWKRRVMVGITGGEPILRPDFFRITAHLRDLGFPWGMVTNGFAVDRDIVRRCRESGMRTVTVSIDGPEPEHDYLRRRAGSYRRAERAVKLLQEPCFLSALQISTVVTHRTVSRLPEMLEIAQRLGVDEWRIIALSPIGRAAEDDELRLRADDYHRAFLFIRACRQACVRPRVTFDEEGFLGCAWEGEVRDRFYNCYAGTRVGGILCKGEIAACPSIPHHLVQGNVRQDSFVDVWERGFRPFRDRRWMKQGPCASCGDFGICLGNSLHLWDFENNQTKVCHRDLLAGAAMSTLTTGTPEAVGAGAWTAETAGSAPRGAGERVRDVAPKSAGGGT